MKLIHNIFLIDDDDTFTFLTARIIKATQRVENVKRFGNGRDAIDYLVEHANEPELLPDLVFFDLNMPILDGWGFIEEFAETEASFKKKMKLFVVTSSFSVLDIQRAKSYSIISDYLIKPVQKEKFLDIITQYESQG